MPEVPVEEAKELLKTFGILYLKNYGASVFEKIKNELAANQSGDELRLKYRPPHAVQRQDLFKGECYVKSGEGPGSFSDWKKRFIVERSDNSIDIFANEEAYAKQKKPVSTIRTAGYKVVTEVSDYYASAMREIADGLGLDETEVIALTTCSRYSWALAHPQRQNYIFQLHEGKNASCSCLGGKATVDPDESGADRRDDIINYVGAMQQCVARANAVCNASTEISRIAFRKVCLQIPSKIDTLTNWTDNGAEGEVLVDLLIAALLPPVRNDIFNELKGPASIKIKLWYKAVGLIQAAMVKLVEPAWDQMQKGAQKLESGVEAAIRPAVSKILAIQATVEGKIQDKVAGPLNSSLSSYVTPFIKPVIDSFESPLKRGFVFGREILSAKLDAQTLSQNKEARDAYLDSVAWSPISTANIRLAARDVVEPLKKLTSLNSEVFGDLDPEEHRSNAEEMLLQTLDAAVYTLAVHLDNGTQFNDTLLQQVLADYDHDSVIRRREFVSDVARSILIGAFKKLTSPITEPVVSAISGAIPDEMQDFLNIENILDTFIDQFVGKAIDKVVSTTYQQ